MIGSHAFLVIHGHGRNREMDRIEDQRLKPVYSIPEAAGYLKIPINTLYAWAIGRPKRMGGIYEPVLQFVDPNSKRLSFYDLVEAHLLRAAVDKDIPILRIKRGLKYLREQHPNNLRPLLRYDFLTEGKYLLVGGMLGPKAKDREALINASESGQLVMTPVIERELKPLLDRFDDYFKLVGRDKKKIPITLFPKDGGKVISITSGIYSGRPVIEGTRIPTSVIAQRYAAGEDIPEIARDYRISKEKIEAAVKYESAA
jgi:uncharacterized protein (DUF433 family)